MIWLAIVAGLACVVATFPARLFGAALGHLVRRTLKSEYQDTPKGHSHDR